jgi:hypothetical protein
VKFYENLVSCLHLPERGREIEREREREREAMFSITAEKCYSTQAV